MENNKFVLKRKLICIIVLFLIVALLAVVLVCNRSSILDVIQRQANLPDTQKKVDISTWDSSKVSIITDDDGYKVPVPKGYVASDATGENLVESGFVIYEGTARVTDTNKEEQSKVRNQWVWIPVKDPSRLYTRDRNTGKIKTKLYDYSTTGRVDRDNYEPKLSPIDDTEAIFTQYNYIGMTQDKFLEELELEVEEIIRSIEKYGGFYIARYETGNISTSLPCTKRANEDIYVSNWYDPFIKQKNMAVNSNVMTGMVWGFLYDETLQWLVDVGNKTYETLCSMSKWGRGFYSWKTGYGSDGLVYHTAVATGSNEDWQACNIYDLSGNCAELTTEWEDGAPFRRMVSRKNYRMVCNY